MQIELNLNTVPCVDVCEATSPGAFLPFTVLPEHYRGQTVALVIITPEMRHTQANEDAWLRDHKDQADLPFSFTIPTQ